MECADVSRAMRRLLLGSVSVAAVLTGLAGPANASTCDINDSGGSYSSVSNAGAIACIDLSNGASVTGNVTNTGTGVITATGATAPLGTGVTINGSTVGGTIVNAGTIGSRSGIGILINGAAITGGISNSGTISAAKTNILVENISTFSGGIANSGTVADVSGAAGIDVKSVSVFTGGISNSGVIGAINAGGINLSNISSFSGGISNSGTLTGFGAIGIQSMSTFSGGIANSGSMRDVVVNSVVKFDTGISNAATGVMANGLTGIAVTNTSTFSGGITNAGTISATSFGILEQFDANVSGGITNSGSITAGPEGIFVSADTTFSGGITNSGTIAAALGIGAYNTSTFTGDITNSGTLVGTPGLGPGGAIGLHNFSLFNGNIVNSGSVQGNIFLTNISTYAPNATFAGDIVNGSAGRLGGIFISSAAQFGSSSVSGGITNAGTISGATGIHVAHIATFFGGISNSGTISGGNTGIIIFKASTFSGGITNSGTISDSEIMIDVLDVSTFAGGIDNSGTLRSTLDSGINVDNISTFSGGITNSGTIAVGNVGVDILADSTFSGGITNSGTISTSGPNGALYVVDVSTFLGGITNTGTLTASNGTGKGILAQSGASFAGGITNAGGLVNSGGAGIIVANYSAFAGAIVNTSGSIISSRGIGVSVGGITTFGTASPAGGISNAGTITSGATAIFLQDVSTFLGGVTNSGTITGSVGIVATTSGAISIVDSGTIVGTGGTAIDLTRNTAGNTVTLQPGYAITGLVKGEGSDIFQLGGSGAGAFDLSKIGSQYTGFTTFNVVSGTWTATNGDNHAWTIANGATLQLGNGGTSGLITGNFTDNGTLAFDRSDTVTYGGNVSGSGQVQQLGSGLLVLTGALNNSGGVGLAAGSLDLAAGGSISGANTGIKVLASVPAGSITNAGTISAAAQGIVVSNAAQFGASAGGSIVNAGAIDSNGIEGIFVHLVSTFAGGITNTGTISAAGVSGIGVSHTLTFSGGLTNTGTITAQYNGMEIFAGGSASGALVNDGTITAGQNGIGLFRESLFTGQIVNNGTITISGGSGSGISVLNVSTFTGSITNTGTISSAGSAALAVSRVSTFTGTIVNTGTLTALSSVALFVQASTFHGSITNTGSISGPNGIVVITPSPVSIFDSGTIVGGINLSNATGGNTLTLGPGYAITDLVIGHGSDTFQLGGTGAGTFNLSQIGTQYTGFTTFDIVSGSWTFTGAGTNGWRIQGGGSFDVASGATLAVGSFATAVRLSSTSTFFGNITNDGTISGRSGILIQSTPSFAGNVSNTGQIQAGFAIGVVGGSIFSGNIANSGALSISGGGITVSATSTFAGKIVNSAAGVISGSGEGISVTNVAQFGTSSSGGISNAGTIDANFGISIASVSTFVGGITNTGTIAGATGIVATNSGTISIFDSGTINGTSGTAVDLSGNSAGNTFTLGSGYAITGLVKGQGADAFQLGGTGSGTFNLANLGTQYTGFTTFNVVSGAWMVTGSDTHSWTISNGATFQLGNNGTSGWVSGNFADNGTLIFDRSDTVTYAGAITGSGQVEQSGSGVLVLNSANGYSGGTVLNAGTIQVSADANLGAPASGLTFNGGTLQFAAGFATARAGLVNAGGSTIDTEANTVTLSGAITGPGALTKTGSGTLILTGDDSYNGTMIAQGTLQIGDGGTSGAIAGNTVDNGTLAFDHSDNMTYAGTISGTGQVVQNGGALTLSGASGYSGGTLLNSGEIIVGNNTALGTGTLTMAQGTTLGFAATGSFTIANAIKISGDPTFAPAAGETDVITGPISDGASPGTVELDGPGTLVLAGNNTYTGPTNVNNGTLDVTGSIASSSEITVASGASLVGNGSAKSVQIASGASFVAGGTTQIAGNLTLQSGATFVEEVTPSGAALTNVSGTATISGVSALATFATGSYSSTEYDILHAGSIDGTFTSFDTLGVPPLYSASLVYTATDVFLKLRLNQLPLTGLGGNAQGVGKAINAFVAGGGTLPTNFNPIFNQSGASLGTALSQISGEAATGASNGASDLNAAFLDVLLAPFSGNGEGWSQDARAGNGAVSVHEAQFAPFGHGWSTWVTGYGGAGQTDGDPTGAGTHSVNANVYGVAAGAEYRFSPAIGGTPTDTVLGGALGWGGTSWGLSQTLGHGRSDVLQVALYGASRNGPIYVNAAIAFANHSVTTNRTAFGGDHLQGKYRGQSYSGRLEGGYRFAADSDLGLSPYLAIQAQNFQSPAYSEKDLSGGGFGLSFASARPASTQGEIGLRFDESGLSIGGADLVLRGRAAWAHDWAAAPTLDASFETMPGTSFLVAGAKPSQDSALASASADVTLAPSLVFRVGFDGQFGARSQTYLGSGSIRIAW